jgi:hypothetical protein
LFQTICFLGYSPIHKGVKCIYIPTGRVYISRDVIFDQNIFPIASLHSNAGARLRSELTLLPPALVNPNIPDQGGEITDDHVENGTNPTTNGLVQILLKTMQEIAMKYQEHKCWTRQPDRRRFCHYLRCCGFQRISVGTCDCRHGTARSPASRELAFERHASNQCIGT